MRRTRTGAELVSVPVTAAQRQATMADVAREAGVSTATVSNVLSGRADLMRRVGADAQQRVWDAVGALSYVHNNVARHLRLQRTERLCVLLPRLGIPFADKMAQDIEAVAHRYGYATIVMTASTLEDFSRILREIESGLADALIADLEPLLANHAAQTLAALRRASKPCLLIHADADYRGGFSPMTHQRVPALRQALAHVRAAGHRRIAYVNNNGSRANPRVKELRAFVARHRDMPAPTILDEVNRRDVAVERARDIAALDPRPTAVLVESDYTAVAMLEEFQRLGLSVPADIAVIGCGNAEEGYYCNPRLSTIGPVALSMTEATEHVIALIADRAIGEPQRFDVPWTFYPRESS
jgi:LacI family repressor for deo operon, udp, cdd, tsx, nupC, and nupG